MTQYIYSTSDPASISFNDRPASAKTSESRTFNNASIASLRTLGAAMTEAPGGSGIPFVPTGGALNPPSMYRRLTFSTRTIAS